MYGNYEYASLPYGDFSAVVTVIIINKGDIDSIFISSKKVNLFLANVKPSLFTVARKVSAFVSQEKYGRTT
jgi:hypothetical protein